MTCTDNDGNAGKPAGGYAVMVNQVIMRMQNVGTVAPQLLCDLPDGAQARPGRFLERPHADPLRGCLRREPAGMGQAIDRRLMTFRKLALCEVNDQPFQAAHIEIVDKLYDSHGERSPLIFDFNGYG
jgi:hypothetical protein